VQQQAALNVAHSIASIAGSVHLSASDVVSVLTAALDQQTSSIIPSGKDGARDHATEVFAKGLAILLSDIPHYEFLCNKSPGLWLSSDDIAALTRSSMKAIQ